MATNKTKDKLKGKAQKAKGKAKLARADATGNESKRAEGHKDALKGIATNKKGHLKDLGS
jgi:uncharacterized protein YjbJ (UPF0337 family)